VDCGPVHKPTLPARNRRHLCVADHVLWGTAAGYQAHFPLDVDLLSDLDGVIDLDTEIPNGTFDPMARWP
jgi:hypothetical protein